MSVLSYWLSVSSLVLMVLASLSDGKKMKRILLLLFSGNILLATSYLLGGKGIVGAATSYLGSLMTIINFFFESKNRSIPRWLTVIYLVSLISVNIIVSGGVTGLGLIVIAASVAFVMCIGQKSGKKYRFWVLVNLMLWCMYDIFSGSYSVLITHLSQALFAVAGVLIRDRKE